jgi:hypothetical protein
MMVLTNESDEQIRVTEIELLDERGIRLTELHYLTERNVIEPRKDLGVAWRMETNPADKLVSLQTARAGPMRNFPNLFETELEVRVTCEVLEKVMVYGTRLYVQVDMTNHRINQHVG